MTRPCDMARDRKVFWASFALLSLFAVIVARLFHIQVAAGAVRADEARTREFRNSWQLGRSLAEKGLRGRILDRNGEILAVSYHDFDLVADPGSLARLAPDRAADLLHRVLIDAGIEADRDHLFSRLADRRFRRRVLLSHLTERDREEVRARIPMDAEEGRRLARILDFEAVERRAWPWGSLFAQVVGFVGEDAVARSGVRGRAGLEMGIEGLLEAFDGRFLCEKDARGGEYLRSVEWLDVPAEGGEVVLALDAEIQRIAEEALRRAVERTRARAATAVVLEIGTGRVLALMSVPTFDPHDLGRIDASPPGFVDPRLCRAVQCAYYPGSIFKSFVMAEAIGRGVVGPDEKIHCRNGAAQFLGRTVRDTHGIGLSSLTEIIVHSSNIGMVTIGLQRLGLDGLYALLDRMGCPGKPRVGLPAANAGSRVRREHATAQSAGISICFGMEITVPPLTLASRFAAFAQGGEVIEPILVERVRRDGREIADTPRRFRLFPEPAAKALHEMMKGVVIEGTARRARSRLYSIVGKSGTSEDLPKTLGTFQSGFCGYAPADGPRVLALVVLEGTRRPDHMGGSTAGPAVTEILERSLKLLGVAPDVAASGSDR